MVRIHDSPFKENEKEVIAMGSVEHQTGAKKTGGTSTDQSYLYRPYA
jgi:hypothetical protein